MHTHLVFILSFHTFIALSAFIASSRYTAGGIHIESYLVLVSSCNSCVVINESVMIIIIRELPKKEKKERPKERRKKRKRKKRKKKKIK